tara:strand:+ start:677 stop:1576 length:900 start_codon:yes stop_codon:yes gene_type:complete
VIGTGLGFNSVLNLRSRGLAIAVASFTNATKTLSNIGGTDYEIYTFQADGTITFGRAVDVDSLIIGGGGSGGQRNGGGGGAGEVYRGIRSATAIEYAITVGAGGAPPADTDTHENGDNGASSIALGKTSIGGGGGGSEELGLNSTATKGLNGASGGGGRGYWAGLGGTGTAGFDGGAGLSGGNTAFGSGGGGGAGGIGEAGTSVKGGDGGLFITDDITGTALKYGAGGGGGGDLLETTPLGASSDAIGGNGGSKAILATAATANTGSGGGGGGGGGTAGAPYIAGGAGGSGLVILRIAI